MSAPRNKPTPGWGMALLTVAVVVVIALPTILNDGPVVEGVWIAALLAGLVVAVIRWTLDAPVRRAKAQAGAVARQQAQTEVARLAAERAIWLAPKRIGKVWHHGNCSVNHRTYDTAARCSRG